MATENPIRIMESSGKWHSTSAPNRSGSAPPSIEGSFAAIESLIFRHKIDTNSTILSPKYATNLRDPEEQLRADPSYFAYYWAHVNLNPRLPPPLISDENRHLFRNVGSTGSNQRSTSFDDSSNASFRLTTHKEESDDDKSPKPESENGKHNRDTFPSPESQQSQSVRQPRSTLQAQTYMNMNQFHQNPSNFSPELHRAYMISGNHVYPNMIPSGYFSQQYTIGGYAFNPAPLSPFVTGYPGFVGPNKFYGPLGSPVQPPFAESFHLSSHGNGPIHEQQLGHNSLNSRRVDSTNPYYFGGPANMGVLQFPASAFASPRAPGSPSGHHVFKDPKTYSFLEELKSGKGRRFELSDISGHIVEFCSDQHGSRFIQQKLESCSIEEKESVFMEVLPNASGLITDVFGNYVIQKFFEYGSVEQRRELAKRLQGQILPLSLQMYGCRVIQKALDAIEVEQKIKLVHELDGHVLRCVRDQNGNHVIQKCIESIPTHKIKFIISSFRGQVASLSTHPYGCRVIQRVLEHSTDELQSQFIIDEILDSVYTLAQDQYGNYVTQHVLERGKPEERSEIVHKLSGHIVELSQHKFASNVIEKCLEYGDSKARGILIEEIIGLGDSTDNLLVMVKDQFANYVIQKVVQTCTIDQREALLGRIKVHLNSLKKYTYGKHIVSRFEQLYGEEIEASGS